MILMTIAVLLMTWTFLDGGAKGKRRRRPY
jgi:hypothetical protein